MSKPITLLLVAFVAAAISVTIVGANATNAEAAKKRISLSRYFLKSDADTRKACKDLAMFWGNVWRCEGWFGGPCVRATLHDPNIVDCDQMFFLSGRLQRTHLECNRVRRYHAPSGFVKKKGVGPRWKCKVGPPET